ILAHARDLKQNAPGLDHRHPVVRRTLALAHACLRRLRRDYPIGKDADPQLAAAARVTRDHAAGRLDLPALQPARARRYEGELAEFVPRATRSRPLAAARVHPAVLGPLGHQHPIVSSSRRSRRLARPARRGRWTRAAIAPRAAVAPRATVG